MSTTPTPVVELPRVEPEEVLATLRVENEALTKEWQEIHEKAITTLAKRDENERKRRALEKHISACGPTEKEKGPPAKRKKHEPISSQIKALIIHQILEVGELTWQQAAELYQVSKSSVQRIVHEAREEAARKLACALHEPAPPAPVTKRKGRKSVLDGEDLVEILGWIEDRPSMTLKEVRERAAVDLQKKVSKSTLERTFNTLDIMYKNMTLIPAKWNEESVLNARQHYVRDEVRNFLGRPLVFVDESAFNLHLVAKKGRASRGEPARLSVLPKRTNLTLIGALARTGIIFSKLIDSQESKGKRGVNADDFRLFLLDLRKHLPESAVILLDNASIHKTDVVNDTFDLLRSDGFEVLFLPPYSPFLNPIEYAFSKIKGAVRTMPFHNKSELVDAINNALTTVTATDARDWFTHMIRYYQQCALGLPFTGKPLKPTIFETAPPPTAVQRHQWEASASTEAQPAVPRITPAP